MRPEISVIIPVYNVEKYVGECLNSVVNQTFKNLEIICVDDCTKDRSIEIVENMQKNDSRIKIIRHEHNSGLAVSRNTGIKNAKGKYIFFLDSDDYMKPDTLEKLYNRIVSDKSDIAVSRAQAFYDSECEENKKRVQEHNKVFKNQSCIKQIQITEQNFSYFADNMLHVAWGRLYDSDFIKRNNILFIDKNIIYEDEGFFIKVYSHFPLISYIQEDTGVMYRIRKDSIIGKNHKRKDKKARNQKIKLVKTVIYDAFEHIKEYYGSKKSKKLIKKILKTGAYRKYLSLNIFGIIKYRWFKNDKQISFCGIDIYREKIKNKSHKYYKVLGVTIKKKEIKQKTSSISPLFLGGGVNVLHYPIRSIFND